VVESVYNAIQIDTLYKDDYVWSLKVNIVQESSKGNTKVTKGAIRFPINSCPLFSKQKTADCRKMAYPSL